ncbi:hypothetical protein RRG08_039946 [Elysia crispata]|uniref:Uncharacterized protein n=1 Tax=Elysia crispata TaxID=231223 RepID=A0AAE0Z811_9GAST|nr:hypothetical protein RRG08_039946 [Elysia crispata]
MPCLCVEDSSNAVGRSSVRSRDGRSVTSMTRLNLITFPYLAVSELMSTSPHPFGKLPHKVQPIVPETMPHWQVVYRSSNVQPWQMTS